MIATASQVERLTQRFAGSLAPGDTVEVKQYRAEQVAVDDKGRELTCIINTDSVDLDGEVVVPGGLDFGMFLEKRKVFVDHKYDIDYCVGSLRSLHAYPDRRNIKAWIMRVQMLSGLHNPLADDVLTIARTIGIGTSIGFVKRVARAPGKDDPTHYHKAKRIVESAKVFEASLLYVQANLNCGVVSDSEMQQMKDIGELVTKGLIRPDSAKRMGWLEDGPAPRRLRLGV